MDKKGIEFVQLLDLTDAEKKILLDIHGYGVNDEGMVIDLKTKKPVICPYSRKEVKFSNASIVPGSAAIVMNTDVGTISAYLAEHPKYRFRE